MRYTAAYLTGQGDAPALAGADLTPESSRRARAALRPGRRFARWADRASPISSSDAADCARRFADQLARADGVEVVNDVVLNQVLVRFGDDAHTDAVVRRVQDDGTCWVGATTWRGDRCMRISVSGWSTSDADVDRSAQAMLDVHRGCTGREGAAPAR